MESVVDNRWSSARWRRSRLKPGGLSPGEHEISVEEHIRASYIPMTAVAYATKRVRLT
jgi:hypothetical protein